MKKLKQIILPHLLLGYFVRLLLFFVLETFFLYGIWSWEWQWLFWLLRDWLRWLIVLYVIILWFQWNKLSLYFKNVVRTSRFPFAILVTLLLMGIRSGWVSLSSGFWWYERFVWFKYDWYYLLLIVSWLFVGSVGLVQWLITKNNLRWFLLMFVAVVGAWIIWQLWKVALPDFFVTYLGYWPFGDFFPWEAPPLFYKTWSGGLMRLSGLFVWPNVFWFFLVSVVPLLFLAVKQKFATVSYFMRFERLISWFVRVLWWWCLLLTFSRWAYVAWSLALILSIRLLADESKSMLRKTLLSIILISFSTLLVRWVNFLKQWSNAERGSWNVVALEMLQSNLWWYGPWTAGPARHYWADYSDNEKNSLSLVENVYLQLTVNMGLPGIVLYCLFWLLFLLFLLEQVRYHKGHRNTLTYHVLLGLIIALVCLNIEWLVLHVWRDSQFNFLFLIFVGLVSGYAMNQSFYWKE